MYVAVCVRTQVFGVGLPDFGCPPTLVSPSLVPTPPLTHVRARVHGLPLCAQWEDEIAVERSKTLETTRAPILAQLFPLGVEDGVRRGG